MIIARYKPGDPLHKPAEKFFNRSDTSLHASYLTVVELSAVLSRILDELTVPDDTVKDVRTLVAFIFRDCKLILSPYLYTVSAVIEGQRARMPLEHYLAFKHAEELRLKTLDLLHLCHAAVLKEMMNVNTLITGDEDLISQSQTVRKLFGVRVKHPRDFSR